VQVSWTTSGGAFGTAQGSASWTIPAVPLNIGDNVITLSARDSQQNQVTRSLTITRNPLSSRTPPSPTHPLIQPLGRTQLRRH
jgi:hypothetical protein